ncbi:MAG: hypothetical protein JSV79_09525 [Armatimonadota bacterium]|nr:MAG: hypothetical protein JSV79_09525 [Armatimonadota bacterium]
MKHCPVLLVVASLIVLGIAAGAALAGDIVTVPTANQLKAGEVDLAHYYIGVDDGSLIAGLRDMGIDYVRAQTLYVGLTDTVEIDAHRYDVNEVGVETIWNATVVAQPETLERPIVVLGGRDLSRVYGKASYFLSAAKTLNPPLAGPPTEPIIRLHLSLGTEDNTLFGEERHEGLFGGVQVLFRPANPAVGAIALYDGTDVITGITLVPEPGWPTLKVGTFGGHWWAGISYTFNTK